MRPSTTQLKPLISLASAALTALLFSISAPTSKQPVSAPCGFTQALRTIKTVETLKKHSATSLPGHEYGSGPRVAHFV